MRNILSSILLFSSFLSCQTEQETPEQPQTSVQQEQPITNPEEQLLQTDSLFDTNINAFPKHWVEVKIKHKEIIYTEYCEMGHPHWKLIEGDSSWQIETFYGNDGELWNVINMTANQQLAEEQVLQEGIFVVTKETFPDNEIYEVSYFWNQTAGFCSFGDFFNKETQFADFEKYNSFTIKKEECK